MLIYMHIVCRSDRTADKEHIDRKKQESKYKTDKRKTCNLIMFDHLQRVSRNSYDIVTNVMVKIKQYLSENNKTLSSRVDCNYYV